jgi:predicted nucleic acid-binding protein
MTATTNSSRALVDTNVVVYSYDLDEPRKHDVARVLLEKLSNEARLVLSTQVLNEFCSVMMKPRRRTPLTPQQLVGVLNGLAAAGDIVAIGTRTTLRALDVMPRHGLSFWDALIWSAAVENGVPTIYTEDFQDGRIIEGVRFINPFSTSAATGP